jgi:hypothetical protein
MTTSRPDLPRQNRIDRRRTVAQRVSTLGNPDGEVYEYAGRCRKCGRRTYTVEGHDPDPRGPAGAHAAAHLKAREQLRADEIAAAEAKCGADFVDRLFEFRLCWWCRDNVEDYQAAVARARVEWLRLIAIAPPQRPLAPDLAGCDGAGPHDPTDGLRVLPLSTDPHHGNLILCRACWDHENAWRRERNSQLEPGAQFATQSWSSGRRYGEGC